MVTWLLDAWTIESNTPRVSQIILGYQSQCICQTKILKSAETCASDVWKGNLLHNLFCEVAPIEMVFFTKTLVHLPSERETCRWHLLMSYLDDVFVIPCGMQWAISYRLLSRNLSRSVETLNTPVNSSCKSLDMYVMIHYALFQGSKHPHK